MEIKPSFSLPKIIEGRCVDYTYEGLGVIKYQDFVVFVGNILVGEVAQIEITYQKKNYAYGSVKVLIEESANRSSDFNTNDELCGGCNLKHLNYSEQLKFKKRKIENIIKKQDAKLKVQDVIGMEVPLHYRNKVQMPFQRQGDKWIFGFYKQKTNTIIENHKCQIQTEFSYEVIEFCQDLFDKYHIKSLRHVVIKEAFATGEVMVVFVARFKENAFYMIARKLSKQFLNIKSMILNINKRHDNVILGNEEIVLEGKSYITDILIQKRFNISSASFYQVNPLQTEKLYKLALKLANLTPDSVVLDLYCGIGTIGILAASKVKKVIGIEIVPEAILNAKNNAIINNITNIEFYCSDVKAVKDLVTEAIDIVFIDPPRKGLDYKVIEQIGVLNPSKVVYISCEAETLIRDLQVFKQLGYISKEVYPVDMFPDTFHVETVVLLSRVEK